MSILLNCATVRAKTKEETSENDDDALVREMFN